MRKTVVILLFLGLFSFSVYTQTAKKTRPRVVKTPTETQPTEAQKPVLKDNTGNSGSNIPGPPPVLIDRTKKKSTNPIPADEEVIGDDDDIIQIETNYVTLPVTVLDRNGRFISGLDKNQFQIFENGKLQKIETFASVEKPFTVILMIDVSPSTQYKINEIQDAAISFVDQLRPNDKVMVIAFDERSTVLSQPTSSRYQLRNAIRRASFGDGTSLYDSVDGVINRHLKNIEGRKAVVLFTDGVDTTSRQANYQTTIRNVQEIDALVYPIRYNTYSGYARTRFPGGNNPRPQQRRTSSGSILGDILGGIFGGINVGGGGTSGSGTSAEEYAVGKRYLGELARYSGGRSFEADTIYNLDAAFRSIAEELRRQYSLGYYPESGERGERRTIKVRVKRPNLVVRTKQSYIVGDNN